MASEREIEGMRRAIALAERARGRTSPNPPVGSVVLNADGNQLGEGGTEAAGSRHAEIVALSNASSPAGATLISTLEPCAHHGRTGPCVDALIAAGIARVVIAVRDPNPRAAGGVEKLQAAGIDVELGVLTVEASDTLRPWLHSVSSQRPHVTWKSAQSIDARIAPGTGAPAWITSPEARLDAHYSLRARADAIVVGSTTVASDNPSLTIRTGDPELDSRVPLRVVMDRSGSTSSDAAVRAQQESVRISALDPAATLASLHAEGVVDVLIEGGPTIGSAYFEAGLVDRIVLYVAPTMLGTTCIASMSVSMADLDLVDVVPVGPDLRLTYGVRR